MESTNRRVHTTVPPQSPLAAARWKHLPIAPALPRDNPRALPPDRREETATPRRHRALRRLETPTGHGTARPVDTTRDPNVCVQGVEPPGAWSRRALPGAGSS